MPERPSDKPPWPKSEDELLAYLREMVAWPEGSGEPGEGYGRCVYAAAYAALATFYFMASRLGMTGFQASCADMEFLAQSRGMKHGFMVLDAENLLYPQYDMPARVAKWIAETRPQLAPVAREKLREVEADRIEPHPDVLARWREVSALETPDADRG